MGYPVTVFVHLNSYTHYGTYTLLLYSENLMLEYVAVFFMNGYITKYISLNHIEELFKWDPRSLTRSFSAHQTFRCIS